MSGSDKNVARQGETGVVERVLLMSWAWLETSPIEFTQPKFTLLKITRVKITPSKITRVKITLIKITN